MKTKKVLILLFFSFFYLKIYSQQRVPELDTLSIKGKALLIDKKGFFHEIEFRAADGILWLIQNIDDCLLRIVPTNKQSYFLDSRFFNKGAIKELLIKTE